MSATNSDIRKPKEARPGSIAVSVSDQGTPAVGARISVYADPELICTEFDPQTWASSPTAVFYDAKLTGADGCVLFHNVPAGVYVVTYDQYPEIDAECVEVESGCIKDVCFKLELGASVHMIFLTDDCEPLPCPRPRVGDRTEVRIKFGCAQEQSDKLSMAVATPAIAQTRATISASRAWSPRPARKAWMCPSCCQGAPPPRQVAPLRHPHPRRPRHGSPCPLRWTLWNASAPRSRGMSASRCVAHGPARPRHLPYGPRSATAPRPSLSAAAVIDRLLCQSIPLPDRHKNAVLDRQFRELGDHVYGTAAYDLLKTATEVFLLLECGLKIKKQGAHDALDDTPILDLEYESKVWDQVVNLDLLQEKLRGYLGGKALPYIERVIAAAFPGQKKGGQFCEFELTSRTTDPCFLELIWNYWHEEGMLVQSINAISRRFQNVRAPGERDPLAHLEIDPLRPLNNILWGYVEDERNRLSVKRRVYEYHHQYALNLYGKAVPTLRPADNRSKFLEAFHNLLHTSSEYFKAVQDTTVVPDGYPLLHALREVHLILAQGAHNQFGDLPWTARVEMLMQQWILARPEIRDFLQSRAMVPYREAWMPQVDTMKTLQGWSDVTITHFRDLGVYGEQILLSIRYHNWNDINDEEEAKGWADSWRPEIQGYLHAYRAVTGVDLTNPDTVDYTLPSVHLRKRLSMQQRAR